jgi:hypothetical protein
MVALTVVDYTLARAGAEEVEQAIDAGERLLRDPGVSFQAPKLITAWGRRPG